MTSAIPQYLFFFSAIWLFVVGLIVIIAQRISYGKNLIDNGVNAPYLPKNVRDRWGAIRIIWDSVFWVSVVLTFISAVIFPV